MTPSIRFDLQGTESELVAYHQYFVGEPWDKIDRIAPQLAMLWKMPVEVKGCMVGPDAPPVSETTVVMGIYNPDGTKEIL